MGTEVVHAAPLVMMLRHLASFARRVVARFVENRGILLAGGVGYNTLLSIIPFLTLVVAGLSQFFDEQTIIDMLRPELAALAPREVDTLLSTVQSFLRNRAITGLASVLLLLVFSSVAFRMLEEAIGIIFQSTSAGASRKFWISALLPYIFIAPIMVGLALLTLLTIAVDALGDGAIGLGANVVSMALSVRLVLRLVGFLGIVLLFAALYRVLPVVRVSNRRALVGGLVAATVWRIAGSAMAYYVATISKVSVIYGSLATAIVLLLFLELGFIILLLGAQVIAELEASARAGLLWYQAAPPVAREASVATESPSSPEDRAAPEGPKESVTGSEERA